MDCVIDLPAEDQAQEKDSFFDPGRTPRSLELKALVRAVIQSVYDYEERHGRRQRKRTEKGRETYELTLAAIICDLVHGILRGSDKPIAITRSKQVLGKGSRYRSPALTEKLPNILDTLAQPELDWIVQRKGQRENSFGIGRLTQIWPTDKFIAEVEGYIIDLCHIGRSSFEEVIILKDIKEDSYWDTGKVIDYEDSYTTIGLRSEVVEINQWISSADIRYSNPTVDTSSITLKRYFSRASFGSGGRLFGGFWQPLKKDQRKAGLTINGEPIVALDFDQMSVRILYSMADEVPDDDDLYDIPGLTSPSDKRYRPGVKQVLNAMTFKEGRLRSKPRGSTADLPKKLRIEEIEELIRRRHQPISHLFGTEVGHECQYVESKILIDIILSLKRMGIVCLPVHDCILIRRSDYHSAEGMMRKISANHLGQPCPVSQE